MPRKSDDRYIVCQECGAVCKRFGWIEMTLSALVSRKNICCACLGEDPYCSNCKKLLNRRSTEHGEEATAAADSHVY